MKTVTSRLILIMLCAMVPCGASAQDPHSVAPSKKTAIELGTFANKNTTPLGAKWAFLRDPHGPTADAISNGVRQHLSHALQEEADIAVIERDQAPSSEPPLRGVGPRTLDVTAATGESPRFVVSCATTMTGDTVTIEVRLTDPQTGKLLSATKVEGRPVDLEQNIDSRLRERLASTLTGTESPAEKAVRAAIIKAATWIRKNTVDAVIVKASMTRVKEAPSLQSPTLITVKQGTRLQRLGTEGEWVRIRLESGESGWVYREMVD